MLNRQWLKSFAMLVETGGFTRAAERLGLTQGAVSQHVQHIERATGQLFIRRPRHLELTPTGEALRDYCRDLETLDERLQRRLLDRGSAKGEFSFITPGSVGLALYLPLLELQMRYPELSIRHRFAPEDDALAAVLDGRYELGVSARASFDARLAAEPFMTEPLELVVPAQARVDQWRDLVALGFIDHPDGQAMAARLLPRQFPGEGNVRELKMHGFINQIGLILEPVARGLGFTVLPRFARQAFARQEQIRAVTPVAVSDTLQFVYRSEWPLSARAAFVMAHLRTRALHDLVGDFRTTAGD